MIIVFSFLLLGCFMAGRILAAEWRKSQLQQAAVAISATEVVESSVKSPAPAAVAAVNATKPLSDWEQLIAEKNAKIETLLSQLQSMKTQSQEFEKIKSLLERQIFESRDMNRSIRKEIDFLRTQGHKNQEEISRLNVELNYKNQLIHQHELKMSELRNRISSVASQTPLTINKPATKESADVSDFSFDQLDWRKKLNE